MENVRFFHTHKQKNMLILQVLLFFLTLHVSRSAHIDTKLNALLHEEAENCVSYEEISRDTPSKNPSLVSTTSEGDVYVLDSASSKSYVLNTDSMEFKMKDSDLKLNGDDVFTFFQDEAFAYGNAGLRRAGSEENLISGSARAPVKKGNKLSSLSDGRMILTGEGDEVWIAVPRDAGETRQWTRARGKIARTRKKIKTQAHSLDTQVPRVRRFLRVTVQMYLQTKSDEVNPS